MTQSILVRAPNWVGDAVMSLPFFESLSKNAPDANIACLCRKPLAPLYHTAAGVTRVIALDEAAGPRGWRMVLRNASLLRREDFDLAFCLPPSFGSALMLWRAGIPRRVGHASERRGLFLTDTIPYAGAGKRPHRTEGYLALLDRVWPHAEKERSLHYAPADEAHRKTKEIWSHAAFGSGAPVLGIGPASAQPARIWFAERFAAVATRWIETTGGVVVVLGASSEHSLCAAVCDAAADSRVLNLSGTGDIAVAGAILSRVAAFVGNDSGLVHLAAAVGKPTVVVSGPGDPTEIAPYSDCAVTVEKPLFCAPCHRGTCWRKDKPLECLDLVSVEDVWEALVQLLGKDSDNPLTPPVG